LTFHSGSTTNEYLGKYLKKHTISKARWVFSSGSNESLNLRNNYSVDKSLINIIRPPIDTEIYKIINKTDACIKLNLNSARRYLLFVGRFDDSVKRISSIIRAFHKLAPQYPDVDLLIIGGGNDEQSLKNQSEEMVAGRVLFTGWISKDIEKTLYYNVSECLIMASWREGLPTVIGEAFSCGVPVVSSNVGGIDDMVIEGKSGWLFTPGDDEALQRHLDYVLANPERIKAMRSNVRKIAEQTVSIPVIKKALQQGFTTVMEKEKQYF
jgi:glycosyltransferase involved in cell wall biosynthesis